MLTSKFKFFLLLVIPFLIMVIVNEYVRSSIIENPYSRRVVTNMNPEVCTMKTCSWSCHNNTAYCETNHIKYIGPIKQWIDPIYFGMIGVLKSTGNYGLANIIFLLVGWPLLMWFLLVRCLLLQKRIRQLSHG